MIKNGQFPPRRWLRQAEKEYTNTVREARLRAGIPTQLALAKLSGIPRQTINGLESNRIFLSLPLALRLSEVLQCPLDALIQRKLPVKQSPSVGKGYNVIVLAPRTFLHEISSGLAPPSRN